MNCPHFPMVLHLHRVCLIALRVVEVANHTDITRGTTTRYAGLHASVGAKWEDAMAIE
jgi:hypothetical protein